MSSEAVRYNSLNNGATTVKPKKRSRKASYNFGSSDDSSENDEDIAICDEGMWANSQSSLSNFSSSLNSTSPSFSRVSSPFSEKSTI